MYAIIPQHIPPERRAEVNDKILFCIESGKDTIPAESIYNCYSGLGGLHGLRRADYRNYQEYAEAKREMEMGQFFTPHEICRDMADMLDPQPSEMILDMCCGMGNFFNHLPNHHNTYGFDIDPKAVAVAGHLYPDANIWQCDIRQFMPDTRYDVIIGNPPFNLRFDHRLSQVYYMDKAYDALNPAGLLMLIVPASFLQSGFWEKSKVANVNGKFSFIGQTRLDPDAFAALGVRGFGTKAMAFMRHSAHIGMQPYKADEFVTQEELKQRIVEARAMKSGLKLKLMQESNAVCREEMEQFEYMLAKYLFELKAHGCLNKYIDKAMALVAKFRNQRPPEDCTGDRLKEWERRKLTPNKVLAVIRRYIRNQNMVPRKEVALVKTSYGFKLKGYAPHLLDSTEHKAAGMNGLILGTEELPVPENPTEANRRQIAEARKLIRRKRKQYLLQSTPFSGMRPLPELAEFLDNATFINRDYERCEFTSLQKHDLNLILQKRYALLNWQQGSGKTAAVYQRAKHLLKSGRVRNVIVLAPAIATNMTWEVFMRCNKEDYCMVRSRNDLEDVPPGVFLIVSTSMLCKLKRYLRRFIRFSGRRLCLIFDESDEITNPLSQRTRLILAIFRRLRYKILDTGTTTRNNITELYSQFELLYNNSVNMTCWSPRVYRQNREKEIESDTNDYYGEPFPANRGHVLFRSCHCPGKATVFGIEKQNQDIYNKNALSELIGKTVITRKFRDFAGEKYEVRTHTVMPSAGEREVYRTIIEEFYRICELYYNSTGDAKKDAGLRLMRQIKLLIKACSVPHLIEGYYGDRYPGKVYRIGNMIRSTKGKVAVGCTSISAFEMYAEYLRGSFPDRPVFTVSGAVPFRKRQAIVNEFDSTVNGILVCTQQSLSSSVNIPSCNQIILESLQWNIPRMEQFYFRFIRLDSKERKKVHFVTYGDSVEQNLMALVLTKERLNEFIRSGEVKEQSEIFDEFDISMSVIDSLLRKETDTEGKVRISWGRQHIAN